MLAWPSSGNWFAATGSTLVSERPAGEKLSRPTVGEGCTKGDRRIRGVRTDL